MAHVVVGLRSLDLVEVREATRGAHQLPQRHCVLAKRCRRDDRTVEVAAVGEHEGRHAEATVPDNGVMVGLHIVVRRRIRDRLGHEPAVEPDRLEQFGGNLRAVGLSALNVQSSAGNFVEAVAVVHGGAPQQRGYTHHPPPIGPLPFPRVLLALGAVDLLEGEEPPVDGHAVLPTDVADPDRGLVRPRAHDVEVEPYGLSHEPSIA